jgi:hypothetical protein
MSFLGARVGANIVVDGTTTRRDERITHLSNRMTCGRSSRHRGAGLLGEEPKMSTLAVVEEILRETAVPMTVREIVVRAGARLPSKSKTPDTVVARDLAMDIKRKGEGSLFTRTSPGRYTLRALASAAATGGASPGSVTVTPPAAPAVAATSGALERGRAPLLAAKRDRNTDTASQAS